MKELNNNKNNFPDLICQKFEMEQPNVHWFCDFTELSISVNKKIHVFLLIDSCCNNLLNFAISQRVFDSATVIRTIRSTLNKRKIDYSLKPNLIIHSDRGTQFTSQLYLKFTKEKMNFFTPSMSIPASPTHNAVMERFVKTFKNLKITNKTYTNDNITILEYLKQNFVNKELNLKQIRIVIKDLFEEYNEHKSIKKAKNGSNNEEKIYETKELVNEPLFLQAFSKHAVEKDPRRTEIQLYKNEVRKAYEVIINNLPENLEVQEAVPILLSKLSCIEEHLKQQDEKLDLNLEISATNQTIGLESHKMNVRAFNDIMSSLKTVTDKLDDLQNKKQKREKVEKIKLRAPIYADHYHLFMLNAGSQAMKFKHIRAIQLRLIYTILFYLGIRLNESASLKKEDIINVMESSRLELRHSKTNDIYVHKMGDEGMAQLRSMKEEIDFFFKERKYLSSNGKDEILTSESYIKLVNKDLAETCKKYSIPYNFKSHSFRAGFITRLLRITSLQDTAAIIGHKSVISTMTYKRYNLSDENVKSILAKADKLKSIEIDYSL
jgi:integrase